MEIPKFIWLIINDNHKIAMRLISHISNSGKNVNYYYRDGGEWAISFKIENNKLISKAYNSNTKHLANLLIVECSKEDWKEDNGEYAIENPEKNF